MKNLFGRAWDWFRYEATYAWSHPPWDFRTLRFYLLGTMLASLALQVLMALLILLFVVGHLIGGATIFKGIVGLVLIAVGGFLVAFAFKYEAGEAGHARYKKEHPDD